MELPTGLPPQSAPRLTQTAGVSDPRQVVRSGYDAAAAWYTSARTPVGSDVEALAQLTTRVPRGARVLDIGCGAGVPVAERLVREGFEVVGVDLSFAQLALGVQRSPHARLIQADMTALPFAQETFSGAVAYYSIIHVPREEHVVVFAELRRVLRLGGYALLVLGAGDLPADHDDDSWFGVPMYWSHFGASANLDLLAGVGLFVEWNALIDDPMGHGQHLFAVARRPAMR